MKTHLLTLLATASLMGAAAQSTAQTPVYLDVNQPIEQRIDDAMKRMTTEEKVGLLHAQSKFSSAGVKRLGIPEVWCSDGPMGIRDEVLWDEWEQAGWTSDSCIAFPSLTCLAATWNTDMAALYGKSIGEEALYRRKNVLLGPGVNICRTPINGRTFEYMSEDPYLAAQLVVPYVKGVQQNGVAACVKHFALNNFEVNRSSANVIVSDRALYEIYLPAFHAAVTEGGAWAIMGSYNLYQNQHCCHNKRLLIDILKGDWKFDGVVISDWGGCHNTDEAVANGLDLEFGTWTGGKTWGRSNSYDSYFLAKPYLDGIKSGKYTTTELDDKVRRVLRLIFRTSMSGQAKWGSLCSDEHYAAARKIANEGIVLLKNDRNILPIDASKNPKILVVGENAIKMLTLGGGSTSLKVQRELLPLDGLRNRFGAENVQYARGYVGDTTTTFDGIDTGQKLADHRSAQELTDEAVRMAKDVDFVIFVGGMNKSNGQDCEGTDRKSLELPYNQNNVVSEIVKVNPNLIFVNITGSPVTMPWLDKVPAVVQTWFIGSEAGNAIADVLSGDVNPSGKLPLTYPAKLEDVGAHSVGEYVGNFSRTVVNVEYKEDILVGYRWFDTKKIKPLFPFGYGLSYTTFSYGKPSLSQTSMTADGSVTVKVDVTNTGKRAGAEVVQLYIADLKSSLPRPAKELKGFKKVQLNPGETKTVEFTIDRSALEFYNDATKQWTAEPGAFEAIIGASATDIKGKVKFELK
ncbi:MAG: glycoside hydrolase family 3 C-terminal domain-containing protein [Salinivirgaceae bacterium]|nr:glycoside hydrolase family 3 C-terminal domain-containing protein [Salinivirgaceae bacterium]